MLRKDVRKTSPVASGISFAVATARHPRLAKVRHAGGARSSLPPSWIARGRELRRHARRALDAVADQPRSQCHLPAVPPQGLTPRGAVAPARAGDRRCRLRSVAPARRLDGAACACAPRSESKKIRWGCPQGSAPHPARENATADISSASLAPRTRRPEAPGPSPRRGGASGIASSPHAQAGDTRVAASLQQKWPQSALRERPENHDGFP